MFSYQACTSPHSYGDLVRDMPPTEGSARPSRGGHFGAVAQMRSRPVDLPNNLIQPHLLGRILLIKTTHLLLHQLSDQTRVSGDFVSLS